MKPQNLFCTEGYFEASEGRKLFFRSWRPARPDRLMILVHGFGEHSGRYEEASTYFAGRGFAVYAHDHQGHGRSPGKRGHVNRFEDLLDDVERFIVFAAKAQPFLPRILVGHSMGGLIVAALACERNVDVNLVVVSGAALSLSPEISRLKLISARFLRKLMPRLTMNAGLDPNGLSRDPTVVRDYIADPLVHGRVTASMGAGMFEVIRRVQGKADSLSVPMLLMHGESDPICQVEGSRAFYAALSHDAPSTGSELRTYPDLLHEIFNEPERSQVYGDLHDWVLRMESL